MTDADLPLCFDPSDLAYALWWAAHIPDLGGWSAEIIVAGNGDEAVYVFHGLGVAYALRRLEEGAVEVTWDDDRALRSGREVLPTLRDALQLIRPITPSLQATIEAAVASGALPPPSHSDLHD